MNFDRVYLHRIYLPLAESDMVYRKHGRVPLPDGQHPWSANQTAGLHMHGAPIYLGPLVLLAEDRTEVFDGRRAVLS